MRKIERGERPDALDGIKNGKTELERAHEHFVDNRLVNDFAFEAYAHRDVKAALSKMSGGKCAYCEAFYEVTQPQDTEHYRPKGRIDTDAGKLSPGYWWLASDWENLLPSCTHCNRLYNHTLPSGETLRSGKGELFPLADEATRAKAAGNEANEIALLIDPCREDPAALIVFVEENGFSIAKPASEDSESIEARRARTSIDIYGLNRPWLVHDRSTDLARVKLSLRHVQRLARQLETADEIEAAEIEQDFLDEVAFLRNNASGKTGYAGMSRSLIEPVFASLGLTLTI